MDIPPIILLIYRRPAETALVREALRAARPSRLIIVADGPRADRPDDAPAVAAARAAAEAVDWPCEITRIYADSNMGLRSRVESGITTAFTLVERAIILEDDCLPAPSFFPFCAELLDRYADETRVMAISGDDFQGGRPATASYRFSRYPHCWGWATWRRAWQHYNGPMHDWPALRTSGWLEEYLGGRRAADYWRRVFDQVHAGQIDSWAYRWTYSCWRRGGLTALPTQNLVSNIGFGAGATHTVAAHNPFAAMPSYALPFPLRHPPRVAADSRADAYTQATLYNPGLARRALWRISRTLRPKEPMFVQLRHAIVKTLKALRHRLPGTFKQTSYSQEGEDLILRRVFEPQRGGFYVDVGAHHPQRFSNTCLFYALRWSGINIDATPGSMRLFKRLRPRDINLELAVGEAGPPKNFFVFNERAINTFDPEHAQRCVARGYKIVAQIPIPTRALGDILHQHMPPGRRIDFLSVDVEGLDLEVLRSNDWVRFKPTYILVELREDIETIASHPVAVFLHGHGYRIFAKTANTTFFCHRQQLAGEGK